MSDSKAILIYNAVLELINREQNPYKITVSEIADKCGIGKGTVYEYFKSKNDIILCTVKHFVDLVIVDIEKLPKGKFYEMFSNFYKVLEGMQTKCKAVYFTLMFDDRRFNTECNDSEEINNTLTPLKRSMESYILLMIDKGRQEGIIPQKVESSSILFAVLGTISSIFVANSPITDLYRDASQDKVEECYRCFLKQLL